jgi:TolA-binding protein
MENNIKSFFEKKWTYVSIVLMGILATGGALTPVAFAQNRQGQPAVWNAIDNLQEQIDDLVAAVESLETRIEALETENANLQEQINAQDARIDALEEGGNGDADQDGDGFSSSVDCDDSNPNVNPNATEVPSDSIDNDCDGVVDVS